MKVAALDRVRSKHIVVTAVAGVALGGMIQGGPAAIALIVPTWVGLIGLLCLTHFLSPDDPRVRRRLLGWVLLGFSSHLVFGLVVTYGGAFIQKYLGAPDAGAYHYNAIWLLRHWTEGFPAPELAAGKEGFYYLLAALYRVFGPHRVAGLALNAALSAAIVPLMYDATRRLFDEHSARYIPPLVVLIPNLLIFSSQLLKEAPILFLIAVVINCATRLTERISVVSLVALGSGLCLLLTLRAWVALVLAAGVLASVGLGRREVIVGVGAGLSAAAIIAATVAFGLGYSGYRAASKSNLEEANVARRNTSVGVGSGFDAEADVSNPVAAISYLPRGLATFILGPFPWQIGRATQLVVIPDLVVWWSLLPSLWRGARHGWARTGRRMLVLVLPAFAVSTMLALAVGNFGTVVRERAQPLVILLPLIALGWAMRERPTRAHSSGTPTVTVSP